MRVSCMARVRVVLQLMALAVAICLPSLSANRALAQEEEVDALLAADAAEAQALAQAEVFMAEEEATLETTILPQVGAFTAAADEALAESSAVIGPVANPTADPVLGDG